MNGSEVYFGPCQLESTSWKTRNTKTGFRDVLIDDECSKDSLQQLRDGLKTLSNIYDGAFFANVVNSKGNYFRE